MTRSELHQRFIAEFSHARPSPNPVPQEVDRIEEELGTVLPLSYISFLQKYCAPWTPSILDVVVERGKNTPDLQQFLTVEEAVLHSRLYWSGGMPDHLIGFASDCMGSMFCFRRVPVGTPRSDDAEVWFFDHDYCREYKLTDSFDVLLLSFLKLKVPELTTDEVVS